MCEFDSLDRCAAYVASRAMLAAIHAAVSVWPADLAERARQAATETLMMTAQATGHAHGTAGRRVCLRTAIGTAIEVAAACDVAHAIGHDSVALVHAQGQAGRAIALLGLFFHASATVDPDFVRPEGRSGLLTL